jgi:predicted nucleic acid-binding protein
MRLLLDANIILDDALSRPGVAAASKAVIKTCGVHHEAWVAWHTLSNVFYIVERHPVQGASALQIIADLLTWTEVAGTSRIAAVRAVQMGMTDFEDALQAAAAEACRADLIITRNVADFRGSPVPALAPVDFLAQFHPHSNP